MPYEVVEGFVTAPGATLTALTMSSGDSLVVRQSTRPKLLNAWVDAQAAGVLRIRSPLMHDAVQGLRFTTVIDTVKPNVPLGLYQPLQKGDTITAELSGSATAGDIESAALLIHYDSLEGSEGQFIDEATLRSNAVQPFTVENTLALGTTGGWSGEEAINTEFDVFKADALYALVGYQVSGNCVALGWRGTDTGNLRVGGPGASSEKTMTSEWFILLSRAYGIPMIPVFKANNKGAIFIGGATDENGTDVTVQSIFMQVTPEALKKAASTSAPTSRAPTPVGSTAPKLSPVGGAMPRIASFIGR